MSDWILTVLSKLDVPNLLAIAAMFWVFKSRLDKKFDKIDQRFEKVELRLNDVEKRLIVIETTLHLKECCMLTESRMHKKAE